MEKIILTRGRYENNFILNFLPKKILNSLTICCHAGEAVFYKEKFGDLVKEIKEYKGSNVAEARHWCIENSKEDKVLFLEDNISLFIRGVEPDFGETNGSMLYKLDNTRFAEFKVVNYIEELFKKIEVKLLDEDFAIAGVSSRNGNNNIKESFAENCRLYGFWAIDKLKYNNIKQNINDVKYREDFYIMLSFIRNCYKIGVYYDYCFNKVAGVNSSGGCSNYRKQSETNDNADFLAKTFHPFVVVSVNEKKNWVGYEGRVKDVKVQWKKMFNYYKEKSESLTLF